MGVLLCGEDEGSEEEKEEEELGEHGCVDEVTTRVDLQMGREEESL